MAQASRLCCTQVKRKGKCPHTSIALPRPCLANSVDVTFQRGNRENESQPKCVRVHPAVNKSTFHNNASNDAMDIQQPGTRLRHFKSWKGFILFCSYCQSDAKKQLDTILGLVCVVKWTLGLQNGQNTPSNEGPKVMTIHC